MDEDLRVLERRWRETGDSADGSALERALYRAGRVGYSVYPDLQRFGRSQAELRVSIEADSSGLSGLLHPRVVGSDGVLVYRMLRSDEVMVACLADSSLLKKRRWSGASFVTSANDSAFEVRPRCSYLLTVEGTDERYEWPVQVGQLGGEAGKDYFVCDRSDERYSTSSRGYRGLPKNVAKSLPAWVALAGGDVKLLSDFVDLQYSVLKQDYGHDEGMGCWVSEGDGLRAVAFDLIIGNVGAAIGVYIDSFARSLRVAPINASPQGEPQVRTQARR